MNRTSILDQTRTPILVGRAALLIAGALALTSFFLAIAPWQQTASGSGAVMAFSPMDRAQPIEAPVKGRVIKWHVVEGSRVDAGDLLLEIQDVDPNYVARLEQERAAIRNQLEAAQAQAGAYDNQATAYSNLQEMAVRAAARKIDMAEQKIEAAKRKLEAAQAGRKASSLNLTRTRNLAKEGLVSSREGELAELAIAKAENEVGIAAAAVAEARVAKLRLRPNVS